MTSIRDARIGYFFVNRFTEIEIANSDYIRDGQLTKQDGCAIAKMTAQCAPYMGALKIFGTP